MPDIGWEKRIEERHWDRRDIMQLDELILDVVRDTVVRRMVHDLANNDWPDMRVSVRGARASAKFRHRCRVVHTKRAGAHGYKLLLANTRDIAAKGDRVIGSTEFHAGAIASQGIVGSRRENGFITF